MVISMTLKQKTERAAAGVAIDKLLDYVGKKPDENLLKLVDKVEKLTGDMFPKANFKKFREGAEDKDNVWRKLLLSVFADVDRRIVKNMLLALGLGGAYEGTKTVRENREKYNCNIPWIILLDPTSACNLRCKGCWAAEYGHQQSLSYEELDSIVTQGKALGTHFYMFTGGEPLIRKDDIIKLCEKHKDCAFLAYTNATLIDQDFCDEVLRVGNLIFAISIEGTQESNDSRRGEGSYQKSIEVMELLKKNRCLFGISVCYTSENVEAVTSEEFVDLMINKGCKFGLYFNYMPIGQNAEESLIPSPEQRTHMYTWLRKMRNGQTGKPMFLMDFQDDGEFVGGCIAGGRNYFHINSAGDIEPCVFIHFSDSNIRTHTLLEALQNPLFQAFYHNQPFNDNHLRPCPMLENPQCLRSIIKQTGAKSTDLIAPEDVDTVCARCDKFAQKWAPQAEKLWQENPHPNPKTQYYRDRKDS